MSSHNADIGDFLKKTYHCDFDHPEIKKLASSLAEGASGQEDVAVNIFYWVRDNIPYSFGSWQKKASDVLRRKRGMCTNKAVLTVTLLRSCGIPAAFGVWKVKGQEYFGQIGIPMLGGKVGRLSTHVFAGVFLNNEWLKIDPSADKILCDKTGYFNETTELVEWNGKTDALEKINLNHIVKEEWPLSDIEYRLKKKPRNAKGILVKMGNIYLDFLRNHLGRVDNPNELENLFKEWLLKNHLIYYFLFISSFKVKNVIRKFKV